MGATTSPCTPLCGVGLGPEPGHQAGLCGDTEQAIRAAPKGFSDGKTHQSTAPALEIPTPRQQLPLGGTGSAHFWHYFGRLETTNLAAGQHPAKTSINLMLVGPRHSALGKVGEGQPSFGTSLLETSDTGAAGPAAGDTRTSQPCSGAQHESQRPTNTEHDHGIPHHVHTFCLGFLSLLFCLLYLFFLTWGTRAASVREPRLPLAPRSPLMGHLRLGAGHQQGQRDPGERKLREKEAAAQKAKGFVLTCTRRLVSVLGWEGG